MLDFAEFEHVCFKPTCGKQHTMLDLSLYLQEQNILAGQYTLPCQPSPYFGVCVSSSSGGKQNVLVEQNAALDLFGHVNFKPLCGKHYIPAAHNAMLDFSLQLGMCVSRPAGGKHDTLATTAKQDAMLHPTLFEHVCFKPQDLCVKHNILAECDAMLDPT